MDIFLQILGVNQRMMISQGAADLVVTADKNPSSLHRRIATSLEMAGCSITLLKLDDEMKPLLDAPASSPFFLQV